MLSRLFEGCGGDLNNSDSVNDSDAVVSGGSPPGSTVFESFKVSELFESWGWG